MNREYDVSHDLRAIHRLGYEAGARGVERQAPRGMLRDEGAAWYRGYDEATGEAA